MKNTELEKFMEEIAVKLNYIVDSEEEFSNLQGIMVQIDKDWLPCSSESRMLMHPLSVIDFNLRETELINTISMSVKVEPFTVNEIFSFLSFKDSLYSICKKILEIRSSREMSSLKLISSHEETNFQHYAREFLKCSEIQKTHPGIFEGDLLHYQQIYLVLSLDYFNVDLNFLREIKNILCLPMCSTLSAGDIEVLQNLKMKLLSHLKDCLNDEMDLRIFNQELNEFAIYGLGMNSIYSLELKQRIMSFLCECAFLSLMEQTRKKAKDVSSDVPKRNIYG